MKLINPIPGAALGQRYGWRGSVAGLPAGLHNGQDWPAATGTPVRAAASGTVRNGWEQGGFGNYVQIWHNGNTEMFYAHLSSFAVASGTYVNQGQVIGYVGSTGASTGPHLHFSVRINGSWVDPLPLIVADTQPKPPAPTTTKRRKKKKMDYACVTYKMSNGNYIVNTFCMGNGVEHIYEMNQLSYIQNVAKTYQCGPISIISKSHFDKIRTENAATRKRIDARK